jgi:hypothetical protein
MLLMTPDLLLLPDPILRVKLFFGMRTRYSIGRVATALS